MSVMGCTWPLFASSMSEAVMSKNKNKHNWFSLVITQSFMAFQGNISGDGGEGEVGDGW